MHKNRLYVRAQVLYLNKDKGSSYLQSSFCGGVEVYIQAFKSLTLHECSYLSTPTAFSSRQNAHRSQYPTNRRFNGHRVMVTRKINKPLLGNESWTPILLFLMWAVSPVNASRSSMELSMAYKCRYRRLQCQEPSQG